VCGGNNKFDNEQYLGLHTQKWEESDSQGLQRVRQTQSDLMGVKHKLGPDTYDEHKRILPKSE
jgi:hypothetical protein